MALRGITGSTNPSGTAISNSLTYSGSAIQVGDLMILATCYAPGGTTTFTDPSGWTQGSALSPALADVLINSSSILHVIVKIAAAGDTGTPTYVTADAGAFGGRWNQQLRVYSGRVNTSIAAAFNNQGGTAAGATLNTPYTYSINGLTALSGDDIVVLTAVNVISAAGGTYTAPITGYANTLVVNTNAIPAPMIGLDKVNASAGATGTLSQVITDSAGASSIIPASFVLSLPQAAAGAAPPAPMYYRKNVLYFI